MKISFKDIFKHKRIVLYLGILLAAGVLLQLMSSSLWGGGDNASSGEPETPAAYLFETAGNTSNPSLNEYTREQELEKRLEEAFSLVEGAGKVKVLVSMDGERETVYATNANNNKSSTQETDTNGGSRQTNSESNQDTPIILTDKSGTNRPLVSKEINPQIMGVVIIAEGGDDVFVKDALTKAASTILGIEVNRVRILKMKGE